MLLAAFAAFVSDSDCICFNAAKNSIAGSYGCILIAWVAWVAAWAVMILKNKMSLYLYLHFYVFCATMVSKDVWGPSTWTLFHTLAEKVKEEHFAALLPEMLVMVKRICMNLPCPDCSAHAIQIMAKVNPAQFPNKESFKVFLLRFHNSVNARTNKRAFTLEELNAKYVRANTFVVVPHFIKVFSHRNTNVRLLINSFHKDMLTKDFIKWMRENGSKFDK